MKKIIISMIFILMIFSFTLFAQGDNEENGEHNREEGEESGELLTLDAVYDYVRNGVRLILTYNEESNSFIGTIENTTNIVLQKVRVEVHLSNGIELGPTIPEDLNPSEKRNVTLQATDKIFTGWTPHSETGNSEHN